MCTNQNKQSILTFHTVGVSNMYLFFEMLKTESLYHRIIWKKSHLFNKLWHIGCILTLLWHNKYTLKSSGGAAELRGMQFWTDSTLAVNLEPVDKNKSAMRFLESELFIVLYV